MGHSNGIKLNIPFYPHLKVRFLPLTPSLFMATSPVTQSATSIPWLDTSFRTRCTAPAAPGPCLSQRSRFGSRDPGVFAMCIMLMYYMNDRYALNICIYIYMYVICLDLPCNSISIQKMKLWFGWIWLETGLLSLTAKNKVVHPTPGFLKTWFCQLPTLPKAVNIAWKSVNIPSKHFKKNVIRKNHVSNRNKTESWRPKAGFRIFQNMAVDSVCVYIYIV